MKHFITIYFAGVLARFVRAILSPRWRAEATPIAVNVSTSSAYEPANSGFSGHFVVLSTYHQVLARFPAWLQNLVSDSGGCAVNSTRQTASLRTEI